MSGSARGLLLIVAPQSRAQACPVSGGNSTLPHCPKLWSHLSDRNDRHHLHDWYGPALYKCRRSVGLCSSSVALLDARFPHRRELRHHDPLCEGLVRETLGNVNAAALQQTGHQLVPFLLVRCLPLLKVERLRSWLSSSIWAVSRSAMISLLPRKTSPDSPSIEIQSPSRISLIPKPRYAPLTVDDERGAAHDTDLPKLAGNNRGMRRSAAKRRQNAGRERKSCNVFRRGLRANEDDIAKLSEFGCSGRCRKRHARWRRPERRRFPARRARRHR